MYNNLTMKNSSVLSLLLVACGAKALELSYPVVERRTMELFTIDNLEDYKLTYSDDAHPKRIEPFTLDLFETDGDLDEDSIALIEQKIAEYLKAVVQEAFPDHAVASVNCDILAQEMITKAVARTRRHLQTDTGSRITNDVTITFEDEPSPVLADVRKVIYAALGDLSSLLSSIRDATEGDELDNLTEIDTNIGVPITPAPSPAPSNDEDPFTGIITDQEEENSRDGVDASIWGAIVAGSALALVFAALLAIRRRSRDQESVVRSEHNVNLFLEDGSDIFSVETGMDKMQRQLSEDLSADSNSQNTGSKNDTTKSGDINEILSDTEGGGVDGSPPVSPTKSMFSFFTGFMSTGEATVPTSNTTKEKNISGKPPMSPLTASNDKRGTPHSIGSSLFTFSEEAENGNDDSNHNKTTRSPNADVSQLSESTHNKSDNDSKLAGLEIQTSVDSSGVAGMTPTSLLGVPDLAGNEEEGAFQNIDLGDNHAFDPFSVSQSMEDHAPTKTKWTLFGFMKSKKKKRELHENSKSDGNRTPGKTEDIEGGYFSDPGPYDTVNSPPQLNLKWDRPKEAVKNAAKARAFVQAINQTYGYTDDLDEESARRRRHAKSTAGDGTTDYQRETMNVDDTMVALDVMSFSDSEMSGYGTSESPKNLQRGPPRHPNGATAPPMLKPLMGGTPNTHGSGSAPGSAQSNFSTGSSDNSQSRQLINDLVWLEKKIAGAKKDQAQQGQGKSPSRAAAIEQSDSLSFASRDGPVFTSGSEDEGFGDVGTPRSKQGSSGGTPKNGMKSIICRDCYAPPGKLKIVIHSTKDGPAVHTVKEGSSLEGHIFAGDLIISVDDVDTRSHTAEQVMRMMTAKTRFERKITVLHIEN